MKIIRNVLLVLFVMLFSANNGRSQQMLFRNYSVIDGLLSNTVWCISQDSKGYMWFGTKNGINRFDGYQFKPYQFNKKNPLSIGNNFIFSIAEINAKTLWIGTQGGVFIFDLERESFQKFTPVGDDLVYDILEDSRGTIWIGTRSSGLFAYNPATKKITSYKSSSKVKSISSDHIRKLAEDGAGNIWIGTFGEGIDIYNPVDRTFKNLRSSNSKLSSNSILTLYKDNGGNMWVGTFYGGLNVWLKDSGKFRSFRKADGNTINDDIVRSIYQPSSGKLYIGTEKGLNVLDLSTNKFSSIVKKTNSPFSLSDNAIYSIFADREGGIWLGTFFGGLNYLQEKGSGFELHYPTGEKNSLSGNAVSVFLEDKPGIFWIGTEDGGLNYYNSFDNTFKQYPFESRQETLSYHNIHSLHKDGKGNIWIGTFAGGLNIYNPTSGKVKNYQNNPKDPSSLSNNNIYVIYEDKDHVIWVGTTNGLNIYDPQTDAFKRVRELGLGKDIIYDIYEDATNTLWFATYNNGLISKSKRSGKWTQYKADGKKGSISSNKVISILDDHSGNLWLGTDGESLNKFNIQDKTFEVFDETCGMEGNVVYGILQDDNRTLWISTNIGLYNFDPAKKTFKLYTNWDNLQSRQFNYNAYYKSSTGKLYFGGIKGFNSFYPDSIKDLNISNKIDFTNFQLFNKDVNINEGSPLDKAINYSDHIVLTHDQSVISFEYAALSFVSPNKTKYAFKMEGFDKEWNFVGTQRKATYTNLPPGKYLFRVKAAANDGSWNAEGASIRVTVRPPFYKTIWAYVTYVILAAIAFIAFRRYTINQTQKENQIKLERIKSRKEQEFYSQKIEFFTAMAHEIRTPLSLIIAPLEKLLSFNKWDPDVQKQLSVMDENSGRLLTLVNQLLDFRRIESEFYSIHKEEADLVPLIQTIYSRFSAMAYQKGVKFTFSTKVSKLMVQIDPEAFTKILSNLLINAFKFTRTKVKIGINEPEQDGKGQTFFSVSVEDDGIGIPATDIDDVFKKFFKVSSGDHHYNNLGGTGIGLSLAKALTEKHDGRLEVSSTEKVNTVFKLRIPYTVSQEGVENKLADVSESDVEEAGDDDSTIILVVEDDKSLNDFIVQSLKMDSYKVLTATNGREALDLLEEHRVDLILSDVMMPVMDGMELCDTIKKNINFSHIPLILLTARSNSESEIEALEAGADSYIVKPFKWKHLSAVVKNLTESRAKLKSKFAEQPFTKANSLTSSSKDKKFLDKVIEIIEQRITDPQLSVEELSKDLAMSRSSLHKKLKSLSGYVPNEFIRLIRLKKAAQLILSQEYNISEISYLVGFNSHSYFSKCFVNQFKMPPSEFLESHRKGATDPVS